MIGMRGMLDLHLARLKGSQCSKHEHVSRLFRPQAAAGYLSTLGAFSSGQTAGLGNKPNCRLMYRPRLRIGIDAVIVEPVIDRYGLTLDQKDSCCAPSMAGKLRRLGRLSRFRGKHEDHKFVIAFVVNIHISTGREDCYPRRNRSQQYDM